MAPASPACPGPPWCCRRVMRQLRVDVVVKNSQGCSAVDWNGAGQPARVRGRAPLRPMHAPRSCTWLHPGASGAASGSHKGEGLAIAASWCHAVPHHSGPQRDASTAPAQQLPRKPGSAAGPAAAHAPAVRITPLPVYQPVPSWYPHPTSLKR